MNLCDKCVHRNVCGNEDAREEAVKVCDDFIDKSVLSVPKREKAMKLSELYKLLRTDMKGEGR